MSLAAGTRLGPYEIVAPLGAGGMGEVYRAKDPRLGREVAIKVLPAALAHDADRLRRFELEARAASSLNHANLLTVFELGNVDGQLFLVTELLDGRSLRAVLAGGERVPVRTAADWGAQIARGLAVAHERGIVHRDLKPENLFVCADGRVKILDFGLAKLTLGDRGAMADAPTVAGATESGVILGTAGYMAPEQVRGEPVDHRADLFSLGCVLYELFGAERAFHGETAVESMSAILRDEPRPLVELRSDLSPALAGLVARCLEKSPARRFQSASDLAWALESGSVIPSGAALSPSPVAAPPRPRRRWLVAAALVGSSFLFVLSVLTLTASRKGSSAGWSGERMVGGSMLVYGPRVSPDGSAVAFIVLDENRQSQIAVTSPGESRWRQLTHERSKGPVLSVAWSRDGRQLFFHRAVPSAVYSVPVLGGDERLVLENANQPAPLPDGSLLVERHAGNSVNRLVRFWPGEAREIPVGPEFADLANASPNGRLAAFADGREAVYFGRRKDDVDRRGPGLWAIDLASGAARPLASELSLPNAEQKYLPSVAADSARDEVLIVAQRGDLYVVFAVPRSGRGAPRPLVHFTAPPWFIDAGADGSIYADQMEVAGSLLRFGIAGGAPQVEARFAGSPGPSSGPLELRGGGVLFTNVQSGRSTLLLASRGRAVPFVETAEETSGPAAALDDERVAFLIGPATGRQLAIATTDGRIVRRLPVPAPGAPMAFASFGDGQRLLYGVQGRLMVLDVSTGATREVAQADYATVDPSTGDLVVRRLGNDGARIRRIGLDGAPRDDFGRSPEIFDEAWSGPMVDAGGRLLVTLGPPETWFVVTGLSTPAERQLRPIPLEFDGDVFTPSWGRDGKVLAVGWEYRSNVWRFTRAKESSR